MNLDNLKAESGITDSQIIEIQIEIMNVLANEHKIMREVLEQISQGNPASIDLAKEVLNFIGAK